MNINFEVLESETDKLIKYFEEELDKEESEPIRAALKKTREFRSLLDLR